MAESQELPVYIINHVFMPPQLPQHDDLDEHNEQALCQNVYYAAREFGDALPPDQRHLWNPISILLGQFSISRHHLALSEESIIRSLQYMQPSSVLAFLIRAQNAGVIIRRDTRSVIFESFEVSPPNKDIMATKGRLLCSFPGPAIQISTHTFHNPNFQVEIARFLASMDVDPLDSVPVTTKANSKISEIRDAEHPRYITQLLTEILRGMGKAAEVPRITKRIGDDILWCDAYKPWRRSATWLVLRVALQTTLVRLSGGYEAYKTFMVFLHTWILKQALQLDLPSHLLDHMRKKTARRLNKLDDAAPSFLLQFVDEAMNETKEVLQRRWMQAQVVQATTLGSTWAPKTLNVIADTELPLSDSRDYLIQSLQDVPSRKAPQSFNPQHIRRFLGVENFTQSSTKLLASAFKSGDNIIALADFEQAVLNDLEDWATPHPLSSERCATIATCIEQYSDAALEAYSSDPELLSIMHLTLFKLWVEFDRMVVAQCPLLASFSPEVPCTLLHSLLTRSSESLEALDCLEVYLNDRNSHAVSGQSVFSSIISNASFAVQYYDLCTDLQALKTRIDEAATRQKQMKVAELQKLKIRYQQLKKSASDLKCEYINKPTENGEWTAVHSANCRKCKLNNQADGMKIDVHEWPLPQHPLEAKAVVFELSPPPVFVIWRRITYMLLRGAYTPDPSAPLDQSVYMQLYKYPALASYYTQNSKVPHIILASTTKSFKKSHYRTQKVSTATDKSICVNHGLQWKLFDTTRNEWVTQEVTKCTIDEHCTIRLPSGRYKSLQYAVSGTLHTSNEMMAGQIEFSPELSLHESFAFARIRSGPRLQWLNILSELRSDSLGFQEEAVYVLLRQAAWQVGPSNADGEREWHIELTKTDFGEVLLGELESLFLRLRANCRNLVGMQVITMLISRLLASATDDVVVTEGFRLMRKVRRVTYGWLKEIAENLGHIEDNSRVQECQMQVCELAATCRGTYDVDIDKASALLFSADDIAIFIHCAVLVYHNSPPSISNVDVRIRNLLHRDLRLSHVMEPLVSRQISHFREGLDNAVIQIWKSYRPSLQWKHLPSPNDRWVTTRTAQQSIQMPQDVQLNLLSGQLLIDGKPLGRLPHNYVSHPTYSRIFGQRIMDVIPADIPGMDFKTSNRVGSSPGDQSSGYQVFFALRPSKSKTGPSQLVIRTQQGTEIMELIPHDIFKNDLPAILVKNQTHWLNVSTSKGDIEVRDLKTRWKSPSDNWRIRFSPEAHSVMRMELHNGSDVLRLIHPGSMTMSMISAQLQHLEDPESMIVTYSESSGRVGVSLPRLRLDFFLNDESEPRLESLSMHGMVIDSDQSSGCMIGLKSQLILCAKDSREPSLREVIIPYSPDSQLSILPSGHHIKVALSTGDQSIVRYLKYTINSTLERLEGDGSMLSGLYQIYLHAITSHCLPDPLTGWTGTEQALEGLRSAGISSFQKLGEDERQTLQRISELSPTRTFYPPQLTAMQSIGWSKYAISPLAQHTDFRTLANSIWHHAETLGMFGASRGVTGCIDSREVSEYLHSRAAFRNGVFLRDQINGPCRPPNDHRDTVYDSRGNLIYTEVEDEGIVCDISAMIFNWESRPLTNDLLYDVLKRWGSILGANEEISLAYSYEWHERDIARYFLSVCNACGTATKTENQYQMLFSLCTWAYTSIDVRPLIPAMFAFATSPSLRDLDPPPWVSYDLSEGLEPTDEKLSEIIFNCALPPDVNADWNFEQMESKILVFNQQCSLEVTELVNIFWGQWPWEMPAVPNSKEWLFDTQRLEGATAMAFQSWLRNNHLFGYIQNVQQIIDESRRLKPTRPTTSYVFSPSNTESHSVFNCLRFHQLLAERDAPDIPQPPTPVQGSFDWSKNTTSHNTNKLRELLQGFRKSTAFSQQDGKPASIQQQYADDLEKSLQSLETEVKVATQNQGLLESRMASIIHANYIQCKEDLQVTYRVIQESLLPSTQAEEALFAAGLWPSLTTRWFLGPLSFGSNVVLTNPWRKTLNSFARVVLLFQRACRLQKYFHSDNKDEVSSELKHTLVEAKDEDDEQLSIRLLIQIDGNFIARPIQINFMREMIAPSSENNTALQLNMGEGKSSIIVPMVAAALSDGQKLVRVVVLKQLTSSMFKLLVQRLGGLANRRIFYLPFSRSPQLTRDQVQQVQNLFLLCIRVRGVLVVQPEHILSFKLMGLDRKFNHAHSAEFINSGVANSLMELQRWLFDNSRDILDESDEVLHVRYQLIYTVGQQQSLQGSPDRWTIIQQTLSILGKHATIVRRTFPDGIEVLDDPSGGYPRIRILKETASKELVRLIGQDISSGALEQCSFHLFPSHLRSLALSYITDLNLTSKDLHLLEDYCKKSEFWNTLLILRGLLAHDILPFVFKEKRWRVDYGLDSSRSMLAVPYRAKDVPSLRAEFSHPDVAILLTCLSYYWQGLSESQLEQCFDLLFKQDNPVLQYDKWIQQSPSIPEQLKHLSSINTYDLDQRAELYRVFHHKPVVIDFFLSYVVFPRDAKEFPQKLATSGWDLAERKHHVTTGFSGTKDGGYLLPTSIDQADPLFQSSTNAKVLGYLLQPENDHYQCMHQGGKPISERDFLHLLSQDSKIRVLLDVGAQILKLSNEEVAAEWLESNSDPRVLAIVFFGSDDEPYVRTRNGMIETFVSSPFRRHLDKCLLYLDDVHTRGTDFMLPSGICAAVTLGPKVTKDRLLQGCMRMRKLGYGHSVMFFAPPDIHNAIRSVAGLHEYDWIRVKDILLWTMLESCTEVVNRISQWTQQGIDHGQREKAWLDFNKLPNTSIKHLESAWIQGEARSLEEMYGFTQARPKPTYIHQLDHYPEIASRYLKWAPSTSFTDSRIEEEQEREIIVEIESERQIERPPEATAAIPRVHDDVRALVRTGIFKTNSTAFVPLFQPLDDQGLFQGKSWSSQHLVSTKDFSVTVQSSKNGNSSDYIRPVNWVLSTIQSTGTIFIVLSPQEVNDLLPDIRSSKSVHLHQYAPRVTQAMKSFEDLNFYCVPPLHPSWVGPDLELTTRLNLWAGQLYLKDEGAYQRLCEFLGLYSWQPGVADVIQPDGFIKPEHRQDFRLSSSFERSPLPYLKILFGSRRKGMDYTPTHMGKILRGRLLTGEDFV